MDSATVVVTPPAALGDRVWSYNNNNGIQDGGEPGLGGVSVSLFRCTDNSLVAGPITTDGNGNYSFSNLVTGIGYYVVFGTLPNYTRSPLLARLRTRPLNA